MPSHGRRPLTWLLALALVVAGAVTAAPATAAVRTSSAAPTSALTLTASRTVVTYGGATTLTARLLDGSAPAAGQTVTFLHHPVGAPATTEVGRAVTGPDGVARLVVTPSVQTPYR